MSRNRGTYEALVAAGTAEEAITIASEAMPKGAEMISSEAISVPSDDETTFQVTLKFRRVTQEEGGY